jgi:hypothetical protein
MASAPDRDTKKETAPALTEADSFSGDYCDAVAG